MRQRQMSMSACPTCMARTGVMFLRGPVDSPLSSSLTGFPRPSLACSCPATIEPYLCSHLKCLSHIAYAQQNNSSLVLAAGTAQCVFAQARARGCMTECASQTMSILHILVPPCASRRDIRYNVTSSRTLRQARAVSTPSFQYQVATGVGHRRKVPKTQTRAQALWKLLRYGGITYCRGLYLVWLLLLAFSVAMIYTYQRST